MTLKLRGIIPPMVTPFGEEERVDEEALRREAHYHLDCGVHGLCVTGSTGEGASLAAEEAAQVARVVVDEVDGQVPVISGIIRDSTREVIRYGLELRDTGVQALQITPAHYLFTPDAEATIEYYGEIAEAVGLPIIIYNVVPWASIAPRTLARILDEIPLVVGVKQSGGDIHALADLLAINPQGGVVLTAIDDLLYPSFMLGARGAIAATLTMAPRLCVRLWEEVGEGRHDEALVIHGKLLPIWRAIDGPNMPARIKAGLVMQGRSGGRPRNPMARVTAKEAKAIRAALENAELIPATAQKR